MLLRDKVVLVTGAGRGIGRECALLAAEQGARVLVNDVGVDLAGGGGGSPGCARSTVDLIRSRGGVAEANMGDITRWGDVGDMVEQARSRLGGVDAVLNAAGNLRGALLHEHSLEDWDSVCDVHLKGAFNLARATIDAFRRQNFGRYVFFTSTSAFHGNFGQAAYAAAKMGVLGLSRVIALENAGLNVCSNAVAPVAWTRMTEAPAINAAVSDARRAVMDGEHRADQPARFCVALLSSKANGQIFGVSGRRISLVSQPRDVRSFELDDDWTMDSILNRVIPEFSSDFYPIGDRKSDDMIMGLKL